MTRFLSMVSMALGGTVYVLWRPLSLNMFSWFEAIGLGRPVGGLRTWAAPYFSSLPSWTILSLPQALWVLSGCLAVHSIWKDITSVPEQLWMGGVLLLGVGFEVGQALGLVPGVFDVWDLSMILIAYVAAQGISWSINRSQVAKKVCT